MNAKFWHEKFWSNLRLNVRQIHVQNCLQVNDIDSPSVTMDLVNTHQTKH